MRNLIAAAVIGVVALTGQAIASETTAKAVANRAVAAKSAANQQVMGMTMAQTLLLAAAVVTIVVIATDDEDKSGGVTTSP